jgi:hypothetical protein
VHWHRMGFAAYWRWKSRPRGGRPRIGKEVRDLIRRMSIENPLWGAPRIHGELLKLGFDVAQSTLSIYLVPRQGRPLQTWKTADCFAAASESLQKLSGCSGPPLRAQVGHGGPFHHFSKADVTSAKWYLAIALVDLTDRWDVKLAASLSKKQIRDQTVLLILSIGISRARTKIGLATFIYNFKRLLFLRHIAPAHHRRILRTVTILISS